MSKRDYRIEPPQRITIKDVADVAGVSYSTVSRVLNDHPGTSEATKKRVRAIAEEMGYRTNSLARSLATQRSKTIGIILPNLTDQFFMDILRAVMEDLTDAGYGVMIYESNWDLEAEKRGINELISKMVDSLIVYPCAQVDGGYMSSIDLPLVVLRPPDSDAEPRRPRIFVTPDEVHGAHLVVKHLRAQGYERLAFFGGPRDSESNQQRLQGVREACAELGGIALEERWAEGRYIVDSGLERWMALEASYEAEGRELPDAIIGGNDLIAVGAMAGIEESGYAVGREIGVVGFDNVALAGIPQIDLTSVSIPRTKMGHVATRELLALLGKHARKPFHAQYLEPELVVRGSTARG